MQVAPIGSGELGLHQAIMDDVEKFPSQLAERFQVRLPDGMRDKLRTAAEGNNRSMNAEIVARLEASFNDEGLFTSEEMHAFADGSMLGTLGVVESLVMCEGYDLSKIIKSLKADSNKRLKAAKLNEKMSQRLMNEILNRK